MLIKCGVFFRCSRLTISVRVSGFSLLATMSIII